MYVSVIGGGTCTDEEAEVAAAVGREIADRGHDLICGGRDGVMAAACRGAHEAGGHTVGILPGPDRGEANEFVETAIATGMENARNVLVVLNGDGVVAVDGGTGTLSELGHALDLGRPVAGLGTHRVEGVPGVEHVSSAREALDYVEGAVGTGVER
ncbi:MAG: TIGR00725 family protein [Haloarculaceae archaeon]